jgi:hypothetical protein
MPLHQRDTYRQVVASYYYSEIAERGLNIVLKEMALIAMLLASLNPVTEEIKSDIEIVYAPQEVGNKLILCSVDYPYRDALQPLCSC